MSKRYQVKFDTAETLLEDLLSDIARAGIDMTGLLVTEITDD